MYLSISYIDWFVFRIGKRNYSLLLVEYKCVVKETKILEYNTYKSTISCDDSGEENEENSNDKN